MGKIIVRGASQLLVLFVITSLCSKVTARNCTNAEFRCDDGICIKSSQRCDTKIDCPDASDERGQGCGLRIFQIIQKPHKWGLVGGALNITCKVRDDNDYPRIVKFQRRSQDDFQWHDIADTSRVYQTNYTANETIGLTRSTVLHINNLQVNDDGSVNDEPYLCCASRNPAGPCDETLRLSISVLQQQNFPRATVTGASVNYGEPANLTCNVTFRGKTGQVDIVAVAWMRNNQAFENGTTVLFSSVNTKDGGDYVCLALVAIRRSTMYRHTFGTARLTVFVKFFNASIKYSVKQRQNITLECPAEGFPLNIQWTRTTKSGSETVIGSGGGKYVAHRPCPYCRFTLTITNLGLDDRGVYICKAVNSAGNGQHVFQLTVEEGTNPPKGSSARSSVHVLLLIVGFLCAIGCVDW